MVTPLCVTLLTGHRILRLIFSGASQSIAIAYIICALLTLIRCQFAKRIVKAIILGLLAVTAVTEIGAVTMTGEPVTSDSMALMLETDTDEASGFFKQYFSFKVIIILTVLLGGITGLVMAVPLMLKKLNRETKCKLTTLAVPALIVTAIFGVFKLCTLSRVVFFNDHTQLLTWVSYAPDEHSIMKITEFKLAHPLTKGIYLYKDYTLQNANIATWEKNQRAALSSPLYVTGDNDFNLVFIIGESFIRSHSSLYGYYLQTNPILETERYAGRLIVFTDMKSAANYTTPSLRNLLNLNDLSSRGGWEEGVYFPLLLKKAGWSVYHYDNQTISPHYDGGIARMIYAPVNMEFTYDGISDSLFRYDGTYVDYIARTLLPKAKGKKKAVFYHLMGQHFPADERFPGQPRFIASDITTDRPWLTDRRRAEVASYDSATFYNDSVTGAIINYWRNSQTMIFYFSDHGEDCWDIAPASARNKQMPDDPTWIERQYSVPFLVWMSDSMMEKHPEIVARINNAASRPGSLDNLGQAILGICGIISPYYNMERDITSDHYTPLPRVSAAGYSLEVIPR